MLSDHDILMKGINPFTPGFEQELVGRKEELRLFESSLSLARSGQPISIFLEGTIGMGKTTLLKKYESLAQKSGAQVARVSAQKSDTLETILKKIANLICQEESIMEKNANEMFAKIYRKNESDLLVILIDNFEKIQPIIQEKLLDMCIDTIEKHMKCIFVFAGVNGKHKTPLTRNVLLKELTKYDIEEMIAQGLKPHNLKMGEECLKAIEEDSSGHPLIIQIICWVLYDKIKETEKMITKGQYSAYLPLIINNLSRELFDDLYEKTAPTQRIVLSMLAQTGQEMRSIEIAQKINKPLNSVTTLLKRLTLRGSIVKVKRGSYRIFNRLYGKYVLMKN